MVRVSTFFASALFIVAGVVLLLEKLGFCWWALPGHLLNFWPVLLIIIGISLFWEGTIPRLPAFIIIVLLVGGVVFLALTFPRSGIPPLI